MSARNPFLLKPSSLSQHTINFNKILEEVPAPKIESIILEKPKLAGVALDAKPTEAPKPNEPQEPTTEKNEEKVEAPSNFLFGESLTDRVINASETQQPTQANEKSNGQFTNGNGTAASKEAGAAVIANADSANNNNAADGNKTGQMFNKQEGGNVDTLLNESSKHVCLENDANTLIRMNCKLFVLDKDAKDQANWAERGYGILKMIESEEGENCKIMMWTDKCFRLVLNTKLFESMTIEKVNRKSIRLNAQDDGTIKMFLIKCGHPNECEELSHKMIYRLKAYKERLAKGVPSKPVAVEVAEKKSETLVRSVFYECDCEIKCLQDTHSEEKTTTKKAKMTVYTSKASGDNNNNKPLFLDISEVNDASKQVLSNRFLKSVKLKEKSAGDELNFEVAQSFHVSYKVTIKTEATVKEFLDLYEQDQKESDDTFSNNSLNNSENSSDDEEEESDSKNNNSTSLESSVADPNKSTLTENTESQDRVEEVVVVSVSKKRRCEDDDEVDEVQNENVKKMTLTESTDGGAKEPEETSTSLKRQASDSQPDSSQEVQFLKKSKDTGDD